MSYHSIINSGAWRFLLTGFFALSLSACGGGGSGGGDDDENPMPTADSISPIEMQAASAEFVLTVTGSDFADGAEVRWNGSARATTLVAGSSDTANPSGLATQLTATITAEDIATPGTAQVTVFNPGPGGGESSAMMFTITNPTPVADTLAPANAAVGGTDFTLTVNGSQFVDGAEVQLNGAPRATTFVSGSELQALILEADIAALGTADITVINPTPGGGTSAALTLSIVDPPTITALSETSALLGSGGLTLVVTGSNFQPGAAVNWNGDPRPTTVDSDTQLTADIPASDIDLAGLVDVTASNPAPAGGMSNAISFAVENPVPVANTLDPTAVVLRGPEFTLMVNGSNFVDGAVVEWNGAARATTFVSDALVMATIPVTDIDIDAAATRNVRVVNPLPGGGPSNDLTFQIENPVPTINVDGLNPNSAVIGGAQFDLVVTGTGFVSTSVVEWNGANLATTFNSATQQVTAVVPAANLTTADTVNIDVTNPSPGGGTSPQSRTFTVNNPQPAIASFDPPNGGAGVGFRLAVIGSNFVNGAQVLFDGQTLNNPTDFRDATRLEVDIDGSEIPNEATIVVTVENPAPAVAPSGGVNFGILVPRAVVDDISPRRVDVGAGTPPMDVFGQNFASGAEVWIAGDPVLTTFVNDTQLSITVPAGVTGTVGRYAVSVVNLPNDDPDNPASQGRSNPETFFVLNGGQSYFYDDFNRPDSSDIGNGWFEKGEFVEDSFFIRNNEVVGEDGNFIYYDKLVTRPEDEDVADVELSLEFTREDPNDPLVDLGRFAQIHARIDRGTVDETAEEIGYLFFVEDTEFASAMIAIQWNTYYDPTPPGQWLPLPGPGTLADPSDRDTTLECYIAELDFGSSLDIGERYRLRFTITGGSPASAGPPVVPEVPVTLTGAIDELFDGQWFEMASTTVTHGTNQPTNNPDLFCIGDGDDVSERARPPVMPPPIFGAGATGFSKWDDPTERYDNFYWITVPPLLPAPPPVP